MVETLQKSIQESTGIEETAKAEQEEFTAGYTWNTKLHMDTAFISRWGSGSIHVVRRELRQRSRRPRSFTAPRPDYTSSLSLDRP